MLHKLEILRRDINRMIESGDYDKNELLRKSQELDEYIVQAMKEKLLLNIGKAKKEE